MVSSLAPVRTRNWWPDLLAVVAFVALTVALAAGHLLAFDQRVADWAFAHQPAALYWTARVLNYLGQGGQVLTPVALILTGLLVWRTRSVRAVFPFVAAFVLTYLTIGPAKLLFDRAAPAFTGPDKTELFNPAAIGKYGMSYPSGHMGNVLVWYTVMAVLIAALLHRPLTRPEWLALRVAPVVIVFCTTVYLGFHWVTDSVAGVLLGLVLARIIARIPWDAIPLPALRGWERPAGLSPPRR
ncbi:putative phosphatase [Actinoplanes missouriensis 431]|uniref:Putative phosphatase n=1 Tax=Actinoplanes missouriensis (strain ATCC 14538 / DSM 43046 / CBS 188.64 / JCM 3121 / NBRC 102363 / NCIMB 12654 / NRRL B-3342 / UNCC 431) TaxID=512565 RepID=I0HIV4_ACTM4|nr:phosphatase PAP2 family protein [Actinoplanes missouriensis]BAL92941.1 putative phosphatase [Actinoplanes missouriensis 431]